MMNLIFIVTISELLTPIMVGITTEALVPKNDLQKEGSKWKLNLDSSKNIIFFSFSGAEVRNLVAYDFLLSIIYGSLSLWIIIIYDHSLEKVYANITSL